MLLQVRNFRGIARADIELKPTGKSPGIALVCGLNSAGKTSTAEAARIVLTRHLYPRGITVGTSNLLVKSGQEAGSIVLSTPDGSVSVSYPKPKVVTDRRPPQSSTFAAGVESYARLDPASRSKLLTEKLGALPTEDDFRNACKDARIPEERIADIWKNITVLDWDGARQKEKEAGAKLKGKWEQVTGVNYGKDRADPKSKNQWYPDGWDLNLAEQTQEVVDLGVTRTRELLEKAIKSDAVTEAQVATWQEQFNALAARQDEIQRLQLEYAEAEKLVEVARTKSRDFAKTIPNEVQLVWPCHACGELNALIDNKLVPPDASKGPTSDEIAEKMDELAKLKLEEKQAEDYRNVTRDEKTKADMLVNQSLHAGVKLEQYASAPKAAADTETVDGIKRALVMGERRQTAKRKKTEADAIQGEIVQQVALCEMLDATGLRQAKLAEKLTAFNGVLEQLCRIAGWQPVSIRPNLEVYLGEHVYDLLAENEQLKADIVLQLAFAGLDESKAIVIDTADRMDAGGRNGLFKLLLHCGLPAIVCMLCKKEDAPNLAQKGLGITYWVENAAATELAA